MLKVLAESTFDGQTGHRHRMSTGLMGLTCYLSVLEDPRIAWEDLRGSPLVTVWNLSEAKVRGRRETHRNNRSYYLS